MTTIPTWPSSLPQAPTSWSRTSRSSTETFDPEVGDPLVHPRSTVQMFEVEVEFEMTIAQIDEFWTFHRVAMRNGVVPFYWADPRSGVVWKWQIVDGPSDDWIGGDMNTLSMRLLQVRKT